MQTPFTLDCQRKTLMKVSWRLLPLIVVGWIKDSTNSFEWALYFMAACAALSTIIACFAKRSTGVLSRESRSL